MSRRAVQRSHLLQGEWAIDPRLQTSVQFLLAGELANPASNFAGRIFGRPQHVLSNCVERILIEDCFLAQFLQPGGRQYHLLSKHLGAHCMHYVRKGIRLVRRLANHLAHLLHHGRKL